MIEILTRLDKVNLSDVIGQQTISYFNDIYATLSTVIHRLLIQTDYFSYESQGKKERQEHNEC